MIGEFLKHSSVDLPYVVEMAGRVVSWSMKEASSSEAITKLTLPTLMDSSHPSKESSHPSGTWISPLEMPRTRTKQVPNKKQGELPQPAKFLIHKTKPNSAHPSQPEKMNDAEPSKAKNRKRESETEVIQKKAKTT